jgi:hypothetical protein
VPKNFKWPIKLKGAYTICFSSASHVLTYSVIPLLGKYILGEISLRGRIFKFAVQNCKEFKVKQVYLAVLIKPIAFLNALKQINPSASAIMKCLSLLEGSWPFINYSIIRK